MSDITFIDLYIFEDKSNLLAVNKTGLYTGTIARIPCRIVSDYNELNIVVELAPTPLRGVKNEVLESNNPPAYCRTYGLRFGSERSPRHWYITGTSITDNLGILLTLHRDTLFDYWRAQGPLELANTPVEVMTESIPSSATKYSGQLMSFKYTSAREFVEEVFPFAYAPLERPDLNLQLVNNVVIDIVSDRATDIYGWTKLVGGTIGLTTYVMNWRDLYLLINTMQSKDILDALRDNIFQGDAFKSIYRIALLPYECPHDAEPLPHYLPIGNAGYNIWVNGVETEGERRDILMYPAWRRLMVTPSDTSDEQIYTRYITRAFTHTYDVNRTEKLEITFPYAGTTDLTSYIEYFDGVFTCVYILDSITGEGVFGVVKGDTFNAHDYSPSRFPDIPFEIMTPIHTASDISWIAIQGNQLDRFYKGFSMATNIMKGNVAGGIAGFIDASKDVTTITPHNNSQSAQATTLMLSGRWQKWGVSAIERSVGAVNSGFKHPTVLLKNLTLQATTQIPLTPYNVQTLKCQQLSWTGNKAVDDDIYNVLTQRGVVFNYGY